MADTTCRSSWSRPTASSGPARPRWSSPAPPRATSASCPDHAPILSLLVDGVVDVHTAEGETWVAAVDARASSRSPTTGSRSSPSTPSCRTRSTSSRRAATSSGPGGRRGRRGRAEAGPRAEARIRAAEKAPPDRRDTVATAPGTPVPATRAEEGRMPLWQWLLDAAGVAARPRPALRHRPGRPPSPALPQRRHLRAQLPRPVRQGRARLASRARALLRRHARVVPDLLAVAAAQAGLAARAS